MRTTVRLDVKLLDRARREAARRGITLTALIERGLELAMRRPIKASAHEHIALPTCKMGGGTMGAVNLDDTAGLLDRMGAPF